MEGVENLCDAYTDTFVSGWDYYARPLAYIYQLEPAKVPWIVEEDIENSGSRIAIHDSSMFNAHYDNILVSGENDYDSIPNKNFKFVHNLCTIFPE